MTRSLPARPDSRPAPSGRPAAKGDRRPRLEARRRVGATPRSLYAALMPPIPIGVEGLVAALAARAGEDAAP